MEIKNERIDHGQAFDWGKASKDYAKYRDIYPKAFYEKLAELSLGIAGQKALDLGTGTGVLPRNMYHYGAKWTGTDISENQITKDVLLPKIHKMLKDNGHFAILFMAWLPEEGEIAAKSEELVLKYNPSWSGGHMTRYPVDTPPWCNDSFVPENKLAFDLPVTFLNRLLSHEASLRRCFSFAYFLPDYSDWH